MPFKDTPAKMHLHATEGCFVLKGDKLEVITAEGRKTLYAPSGPAIPNSFAFNEVEHFLTCIRDDRQPLVDGREGLKSSRVAWALYAHQGTPIAAL
jgi:predicted dehydrogenase